MDDRSLLGPADVSDAELTTMVADLLGADPGRTRLRSAVVSPVDYDLPAITTAARHWVRGTAQVEEVERPFGLFVKHVQSWSRSPLFGFVPEEFREVAATGVPWRTEPLAYRSDLGDRLPPGLTMPTALGVFDLDELSASVWLPELDVVPVVWDLDRYREAAYLLGRLAGSPSVAEVADLGGHDFTVWNYLHGRLSMQVLPMLRAPAVWQHPLVAGAFDDDLRRDLSAAADRAESATAELAATPARASHGDACPNNLLAVEGTDGFVLIDYGFFTPTHVGFDLAQLLVGDVQTGGGGADGLAERDEACTAAYVEGLRAEGDDTPAHVVRRAHALKLLLFSGLSSLPSELLDQEPTPDAHEVAAERAAIARYSLHLVAQTEP